MILTEHAKHFVDFASMPQSVELLDDEIEWKAWNKRGDPVVHIELGKWADLAVIAPLSANSLAKISMVSKLFHSIPFMHIKINIFLLISSLIPFQGLCDNLLMCVVRAWDLKKPLLFCPAMNTRMYDHPITSDQINKLKSWGYHEIPSIAKTLICGDTGNGAMAEVDTIIMEILNKIQK